MNERQIQELVSFGMHIEVRVTPFLLNGQMGVHIRDCEFFDFIAASLYLQQVQATELDESRIGLVA